MRRQRRLLGSSVKSARMVSSSAVVEKAPQTSLASRSRETRYAGNGFKGSSVRSDSRTKS